MTGKNIIRKYDLLYNTTKNALTIVEYLADGTVNQIIYDVTSGTIISESIDHSFRWTKKYVDEAKVPIPETASVGQTIVVKAVDENGKPTEWEAVDMPSGGGSGGDEWELIADITLQEQVTSFSIDKDMDGNPFYLRKYWLAYVWEKVTDGTTIPDYMFLSHNKITMGPNAPGLYTSAFEPAKSDGLRAGYITVELLPNNMEWGQSYRNNTDVLIALEPFKPFITKSNALGPTAFTTNTLAKWFWEIGGTNGVLAAGSRIMLWGVRV